MTAFVVVEMGERGGVSGKEESNVTRAEVEDELLTCLAGHLWWRLLKCRITIWATESDTMAQKVKGCCEIRPHKCHGNRKCVAT